MFTNKEFINYEELTLDQIKRYAKMYIARHNQLSKLKQRNNGFIGHCEVCSKNFKTKDGFLLHFESNFHKKVEQALKNKTNIDN